MWKDFYPQRVVPTDVLAVYEVMLQVIESVWMRGSAGLRFTTFGMKIMQIVFSSVVTVPFYDLFSKIRIHCESGVKVSVYRELSWNYDFSFD